MIVTVLVGSIRRGRMSPRAARLVVRALQRVSNIEARMVDLADFSIPMMIERLKYLSDPDPDIVRFSEVVRQSSVLVVVSPEYNGGAPGVLKNALDYLNEEYAGLPVGIVTVSGGPHGGRSCFASLRTLFTRLDAKVIEEHLQINTVAETLDDGGNDVGGIYREALDRFVRAVVDAQPTGTADEGPAE